MDALVSRDLLCAIFLRGGALHDGAVIIQGDRIAAAACFLPLTTNPVMLRRLGTRHRAAIGVTEETDALAIVVSEETGQISIASRGDLESDVSLERLHERLTRHTTGKISGRAGSGAALEAGRALMPMLRPKNIGWKLGSLCAAVLLWLAVTVDAGYGHQPRRAGLVPESGPRAAGGGRQPGDDARRAARNRGAID